MYTYISNEIIAVQGGTTCHVMQCRWSHGSCVPSLYMMVTKLLLECQSNDILIKYIYSYIILLSEALSMVVTAALLKFRVKLSIFDIFTFYTLDILNYYSSIISISKGIMSASLIN